MPIRRKVAVATSLACAWAYALAAVSAGADPDGSRAGEPQASLRVDHDRSYLVAITTRAGVLGFLGHEHGVLAPEWEAEILYDEAEPASARTALTVRVPALLIDTSEARRRARLTAAGPSADEVPEIRAQMLAAEQLDAAGHSEIRFVSTSVEPIDTLRLRVGGELTLRGLTRRVETEMTVRRIEAFLLFSGELDIRLTDFGIEPVSIGGVVKVGDEVRIRYAVWTLADP